MEEKISITTKKSKKGTLLNFTGEFTIYSVNAAQKQLFKDLDNWESPVSIDLSQLQEIDTAGVQFLLFLKRQLKEANKQVHITKSSEQVDSVLTLLDLNNHFALEA